MNALIAHLRFLRPLRSVLIVAFYTMCSWAFSSESDAATRRLITLVTTLPLLLGMVISGAVHEPMHRPLAQLLPGLRQRQRYTAAATIFLCALAIAHGVHLDTPFSPFAAFGLAAALTALPCLSRHHRLHDSLTLLAALILLWFLRSRSAISDLGVAMTTAPWLFVVCGLAVTWACLALGFSRASVRARAHIPFVAYQTQLFSHLFRAKVSALWRDELAVARRSRRQGHPTAAGRNWTVCTVGPRSLDWLRVLWHANLGVAKHGSILQINLLAAGLTLGFAVVLPLRALMKGTTEYWPTVAQITTPNFGSGVSAVMLHPGACMLCSLMLFSQIIPLPISRARLARVMFWQATAQWAAALIVPFIAIFLVSLIGQAMSRQLLPNFGLSPLFAMNAALAVLLPLLTAAGTTHRGGLHILFATPVVVTVMVLAFTRSSWSPYLLSPLGILSLLPLIAASQWLLWHRLHRHYATADLHLNNTFIHPLVFGTYSSR
ncbi:MAG: hypothetical protein H7343_17295 [Undibacterium sp.]|nr:hypothetical protein [Opitutaceae bacterium]